MSKVRGVEFEYEERYMRYRDDYSNENDEEICHSQHS